MEFWNYANPQGPASADDSQTEESRPETEAGKQLQQKIREIEQKTGAMQVMSHALHSYTGTSERWTKPNYR